jgi:hypothetical protein
VAGRDVQTVSTRAAGAYADFRVLLDSPAEHPGLGFDGYAEALTEVILTSRAEFAVGIFGSWGSGKTTLMQAIKRRLPDDDTVIPVWFAAWRYEKEPNLILPLLDVLREELERKDKLQRGWAHEAAVTVSRAGLAFLKGLRLSASLPGGVGADWEPGKTIEAIKADREGPAPLSFYHAGFRWLDEAIKGLSGEGARRMVIFVDDLDRCLPANALDVLESMKLFFDVEGCVFVVGLDQEIVEKAVAVKYRSIAGEGTQPGIRGSDYVEKMFQVPFTLPRIGTQQLQEYLDTVERNTDLGQAQRKDFTDNVRPHFRWLQGGDSINPREIKRRINDYTIQLKVLSRRLGKPPNPNVVLALLCMYSRSDWKPFYERLAADPSFQKELQDALGKADQPEAVYLKGERLPLPADLTNYLRGPAAAVLEAENLQAYVSAAESTWAIDPWVLEARTEVNRLRRAGDALALVERTPGEAERRITGHVDRLYGLIGTRRESFGPLGDMRRDLDDAVSRLMAIARELEAEVADGAASASRWNSEAVPQLDKLDAGLQAWHRYISLGP